MEDIPFLTDSCRITSFSLTWYPNYCTGADEDEYKRISIFTLQHPISFWLRFVSMNACSWPPVEEAHHP
jgi:hypothetical protein